jgi:hypothetical protein
MAVNGKIIKGFAQKAKLENGDAFLFQRGNEYFYANADALGSGTVVSDTRANVNTAKSASNLSVGALYYLSDKYIWVNALDVDKVDLNALFLARNADYQSAGVYSGITVANGFTVTATGTNLGVWTDALAPASGDVVIWNNLHWLNITGANGASNPTVDTTNWESVSNTDIDTAFTYGYIQEVDFIEYVFDTDTILKRSDSRGNVFTNYDGYDNIDGFVWGDDSVTGNSCTNTFNIANQFYATIKGNLATGRVVVNSTCTLLQYVGNFFNLPASGIYTTYHYGTSDRLTSCTFIGDSGFMYTKDNNISGEVFVKEEVWLSTVAYAGGTTYQLGDFATSGTVTYVYINPTASSGNAPPNATYWQKVFDFTTAGRHLLYLLKYWDNVTKFRLRSNNAAETIDEIVYLDTAVQEIESDFSLEPESGLTVTVANTAHASLANAGEFLSNANSVIDGSLDQWVTFQNFQINNTGTTYVRRVFGNTNYM